MPGARWSLPPGFLLFLIAVPVFFHRRRSPSHVGGPQEVEYTAGLHLSSAKRSPIRHLRFPLFVSSLTLAHILACWSFPSSST